MNSPSPLLYVDAKKVKYLEYNKLSCQHALQLNFLPLLLVWYFMGMLENLEWTLELVTGPGPRA